MHRRGYLAGLLGSTITPGCTSVDTDGVLGGAGEDGSPSGAGSDRTGIAENDADGDWLRDEWEAAGKAPNGLPIPESDPNHRDLFVDIVSLEDATLPAPWQVQFIIDQFAALAVPNPDGESGIAVHVHGPRSIDVSVEDLKAREGVPDTHIGREHAHELYGPDILGERIGTYHVLGVMPEDTYIAGKGGLTAYKVGLVKRGDQRVFVQALLDTLVPPSLQAGCRESDDNCIGYQSYGSTVQVPEAVTDWLAANAYHNVAYDFGKTTAE